MSSRDQKNRVLAALLLLFVLSILPVATALANSVPSLTLWLEFEYEIAEQPKLEGVQILQCANPGCSHPTLLQGYGKCDSQGCVGGEPVPGTAQQPLDCRGDRCVAVLIYANQAVPPLKVVGQFSDRVRESELFADQLPMYGAVAWRITVRDTRLAVTGTEVEPVDPLGLFSSGFFQHLALTLVVELLVAAAVLRGWLKLRGRALLSGSGYVWLANLISYPATWIFWPSLQPFQPIATRYVGYFVALGTIIVAGTVFILSRQREKGRRVQTVLALVLLPVPVVATLLCLFLATLGSGYTGILIAVPGMPAGLTIALAEVFAVSFEAMLLCLLARKTLNLGFRQAALISVLANMSSFLIGLLVTGWL